MPVDAFKMHGPDEGRLLWGVGVQGMSYINDDGHLYAKDMSREIWVRSIKVA